MKVYEYRQSLSALLLAALLLTVLCVYAPPASAETESPETAEIRTVEAATVDEFLKAIAPNTIIILTGRSYDLTRAQGYGVYGSACYGWNEVYDDGWELEIENVRNLTIRAAQPGTEIITVPRYACVLCFTNCSGVTLEGFTAGHTDGPGYCTGAVLGMTDCRDMTVENCDLYGCGTYGLELERCKTVYTVNSTIRDCSYGALYASNCSDLLLDGCSIHGIEAYGGILTLNACRDCAAINTIMSSNTAQNLVYLSGVRNFYMAGCDISRNQFQSMFSCAPYPLTLEGCAFTDNSCEYGWYYNGWEISEHAVAPDGHIYTEEELDALTLISGAVWEKPAQPEITVTAPEVSADGLIHVHNVDELLASIAPNTGIYLEDGVYDLSETTGYGYDSGDYWYWMDCFDGPGLVIHGVEDLLITAAGPHRARIVAEPRYAEVLSFENCGNISLSRFTAGHTQQPGECAGGVLSFMESHDFTVEDCSLFGCGVMGVTAINCRNGELTHTEIYDCTNGAVFFYDSRDIAVNGCNIHDIPGASYQVYDCQNIRVNGEALPEGGSW